MTGFLAIDPGSKDLAWCWYEAGAIRACGLSRSKAKDVVGRAQDHRRALDHYYPCRVVAERMTFRRGRNKGDPQVLIDLNLIAGHMGTEWLTPAQWKGMVPKEVHQPRILAALTHGELCLIESVKPASLRHNVVDAAGIALVVSGRLKGGTK